MRLNGRTPRTQRQGVAFQRRGPPRTRPTLVEKVVPGWRNTGSVKEHLLAKVCPGGGVFLRVAAGTARSWFALAGLEVVWDEVSAGGARGYVRV